MLIFAIPKYRVWRDHSVKWTKDFLEPGALKRLRSDTELCRGTKGLCRSNLALVTVDHGRFKFKLDLPSL